MKKKLRKRRGRPSSAGFCEQRGKGFLKGLKRKITPTKPKHE